MNKFIIVLVSVFLLGGLIAFLNIPGTSRTTAPPVEPEMQGAILNIDTPQISPSGNFLLKLRELDIYPRGATIQIYSQDVPSILLYESDRNVYYRFNFKILWDEAQDRV